MKMNEIIKEKRKALDMTQEQLADRLGVTAPAVHKWEKGTSLPDTALLPALARLLRVDLNTLFSFEKELADQEINCFCNEMIQMMQKDGYEAGFCFAMEKIREFPNCGKLIFNMASSLDGALAIFCVEERGKYTKELETLYERAATSGDEQIRNFANQFLMMKALERQDYERAESLWEALPEVTIDKKMLKATICMNKKENSEAIRILEEELYVVAGKLQNCLIDLLLCFERTERMEELEFCGNTLKKFIDTMGLWKYGSYMADYEIAIAKQDREKVIKSLRPMLNSMKEAYDLHEFPLYQEIAKNSAGAANMKIMLDGFIKNMKKRGLDENGFLKDDKELLKILEEFEER